MQSRANDRQWSEAGDDDDHINAVVLKEDSNKGPRLRQASNSL